MLPVCLVSVCLLSALSALSWSLIQNQPNGTLNGTLQDRELFSGYFGFRDVSGVRCFSPEQELESRIIGGQEAWANSWPWQVSLQFSSMPACGGAIIGPSWVVSAAHCFKRFNKASSWMVLAGKHDLDNPHEPRQQMVGVSEIQNPPGYNPLTKESDLALLRLHTPLVFNRFVRPIDLWMSPLPLFSECTITGWGSTRENGPRVNRLQEVNVTILPPEACDEYYSGKIQPSMFCAGKHTGGADSCQGDSGGPLACFTGSRYELAGLVSWGVGCGRERKPGVYAKIQQHTKWMSEVMDHHGVYADDINTKESMCGMLQSSGCEKIPGLATLSVSKSGGLSVGNVTEPCPFFWPWQVSLQANGRHYCSGVLIQGQWVLTAQHCNVRAEDDVVLGVHDLRFSSSQTVPVDEVFNLPQDGSFPPGSDLSLLRLAVPARFSSNVSPICVPDEEDNEDLDVSWSCVTAGWGVSKAAEPVEPERLHHVGLTLVNQTSCREQWGGLVTGAHICSHPAGSISCMGDSGAPLVCHRRGAYFLFGVVTWGSRRCQADKPAVFSRVSAYCSWISKLTDDS
ncbi:ovochymase-1 isoform X1 [Pungitius pungitius]|uniref:ovochymase-1 isoform X1 n=1 Tax=Pungitius pungitius TaxID=134920 RepID=UPI002E14F5A6